MRFTLANICLHATFNNDHGCHLHKLYLSIPGITRSPYPMHGNSQKTCLWLVLLWRLLQRRRPEARGEGATCSKSRSRRGGRLRFEPGSGEHPGLLLDALRCFRKTHELALALPASCLREPLCVCVCVCVCVLFRLPGYDLGAEGRRSQGGHSSGRLEWWGGTPGGCPCQPWALLLFLFPDQSRAALRTLGEGGGILGPGVGQVPTYVGRVRPQPLAWPSLPESLF